MFDKEMLVQCWMMLYADEEFVSPGLYKQSTNYVIFSKNSSVSSFRYSFSFHELPTFASICFKFFNNVVLSFHSGFSKKRLKFIKPCVVRAFLSYLMSILKTV